MAFLLYYFGLSELRLVHSGNIVDQEKVRSQTFFLNIPPICCKFGTNENSGCEQLLVALYSGEKILGLP